MKCKHEKTPETTYKDKDGKLKCGVCLQKKRPKKISKQKQKKINAWKKEYWKVKNELEYGYKRSMKGTK